MIRFAHSVVESTFFKRFILGTILFAAALVGVETSQALVERHGGLLHALDFVVLCIFTLEVVLRLVAKAPRSWDYFRDPWNVFDFAIVAICWLPMADTHIASVLRLARVLRVLRLVSALPKLQLLVNALLKSLPSMGYVGALLSIHFYMYAVLGVFLFRPQSAEHFGSIGTALLTLFQIVTLEGWADIMALQIPAHPFAAPAFFISFILLGTMIMLNLFIGVIMNGMTEAHEEQLAAEHKRQERGVSLATELEELERNLEQVREQLVVVRRLAAQDKASEPGAPANNGKSAVR